MSIFDTLIVQPIFNVLLFIYGIVPGQDFGIALILFTILVRLIMWPLIKKQLHQTKLIRKIQPELKKIRQKTKGNRMLESQMMMELYKKKGVKPFSSIGLLLLQLPIFIALFRVIQIITMERGEIARYTYDFLTFIPGVRTVVEQPEQFSEFLFGVIDLTRTAIGENGVYLPLLILAVVAAGFQYIQSKQLLPVQKSNKRLRDIMKESASGKDVDQSEVTAIMTGRMVLFLPIILFFVALYLPGALVLYYAMTSVVAVIQQHFVLSKDVDEMEEVAEEATDKPKKNTKKKVSSDAKSSTAKKQSAKARAEKAAEATVVSEPKKQAKTVKTKAKSRQKPGSKQKRR